MPRSTVRRKLAADAGQSLLEFTEPRRREADGQFLVIHPLVRSLAAHFASSSRGRGRAGRNRPTNCRRQGEVTTIAEEEAPRLLPPRFIVFLGTGGGVSRAVRLCARSGDEGRERTTTTTRRTARTTGLLLSLLNDGRRRAAAGGRGARGRRVDVVLDGGDGRKRTISRPQAEGRDVE